MKPKTRGIRLPQVRLAVRVVINALQVEANQMSCWSRDKTNVYNFERQMKELHETEG